jgi:hypothetical protein
MSTFNLDMTTDQITAEFYIEGTTGGAAVGNIAVLNLDGNVGNVLRGDGTWGTGGSGGGTANVAGSNGQLQYNNSGNLGAVTGVTTDGANLTFGTVAAIKVGGGSNGQVLQSDGSGNLHFATIPGYVNIPRFQLTAPNVTANNVSFTDPLFAYYSGDATKMSIFTMGVLDDKDDWKLVGNTLTRTVWTPADSQFDILPQTIAIASNELAGNVTLQEVTAGNITATSFTGDGANLTGLPGGSFISNNTTSIQTYNRGNVEVIIDDVTLITVDSVGMEVNGPIIPASNIAYDLGNPERRWRDLYLSNNSIVLGDTTLSVGGASGTLAVDGVEMLTAPDGVLTVDVVEANAVSGNGYGMFGIVAANVVGNIAVATFAESSNVAAVANLVEYSNIANIGNISSVDLDGNVANVLLGDGSWGVAASGNISAINLNGNSATWLRGNGTWANISVPAGNIGAVNLSGNGSQVLAGNGAWVTPTSGGGNLDFGTFTQSAGFTLDMGTIV